MDIAYFLNFSERNLQILYGKQGGEKRKKTAYDDFDKMP